MRGPTVRVVRRWKVSIGPRRRRSVKVYLGVVAEPSRDPWCSLTEDENGDGIEGLRDHSHVASRTIH